MDRRADCLYQFGQLYSHHSSSLSLRPKFGLNDFQASLLTSGYAIAQFFATPILGRLSDGFGRKPLLVISLIGTVVANLIASFTSVASLLFVARIFDGLTGGNTSDRYHRHHQ